MSAWMQSGAWASVACTVPRNSARTYCRDSGRMPVFAPGGRARSARRTLHPAVRASPMTIRISVIIPAFNMARFLPDAIASIARQGVSGRRDPGHRPGLDRRHRRHGRGAHGGWGADPLYPGRELRSRAGAQSGAGPGGGRCHRLSRCRRSLACRQARAAGEPARRAEPAGRNGVRLRALFRGSRSRDPGAGRGLCASRRCSMSISAPVLYRRRVFDRVGGFRSVLALQRGCRPVAAHPRAGHPPSPSCGRSRCSTRKHPASMMVQPDPRRTVDFRRSIARFPSCGGLQARPGGRPAAARSLSGA